MKKVLMFRLPKYAHKLLLNIVSRHNFKSCTALVNLILINSVYHATVKHYKPHSRAFNNDEVSIPMGIRIDSNYKDLIVNTCCKQVRNTPCYWCSLAVYDWLIEYQNIIEKEKRRGDPYIYQQFIDNFGNHLKQNVDRLQVEIDHKHNFKVVSTTNRQ